MDLQSLLEGSLEDALPLLEKHAADVRAGIEKTGDGLGHSLATFARGIGSSVASGGQQLGNWFQSTPYRGALTSAGIGAAAGAGLGGLAGMVSGPSGHRRPFLGAALGGVLGGALGGGYGLMPHLTRNLQNLRDRPDAPNTRRANTLESGISRGLSEARDNMVMAGQDSFLGLGAADPTIRPRAAWQAAMEGRPADAARNLTPTNTLDTNPGAHLGTAAGTEAARRLINSRWDPYTVRHGLAATDPVAQLSDTQINRALWRPQFTGGGSAIVGSVGGRSIAPHILQRLNDFGASLRGGTPTLSASNIERALEEASRPLPRPGPALSSTPLAANPARSLLDPDELAALRAAISRPDADALLQDAVRGRMRPAYHLHTGETTYPATGLSHGATNVTRQQVRQALSNHRSTAGTLGRWLSAPLAHGVTQYGLNQFLDAQRLQGAGYNDQSLEDLNRLLGSVGRISENQPAQTGAAIPAGNTAGASLNSIQRQIAELEGILQSAQNRR